jgi:Domain of unknown function (DUF4157)
MQALVNLQRSHGNRFVQRFLGATVLQRGCGCGGTCSDCSSRPTSETEELESANIQRESAGDAGSSKAPRSVYETLESPGQALNPGVRGHMESHFGADFNQVRVHTGSKADESCKSVHALAYTVGQDIAFANGQYAPDTPAGQRLLAHELVHTVQQRGVSPQQDLSIGEPDTPLEREADQVSEAFATESHIDTSHQPAEQAQRANWSGGESEASNNNHGTPMGADSSPATNRVGGAIVGGLIGAGLGFAVGGPIGAVVGGVLGGVTGAAVGGGSGVAKMTACIQPIVIADDDGKNPTTAPSFDHKGHPDYQQDGLQNPRGITLKHSLR